MLATHLQTRTSHSIVVRLLAIGAFTALTAISARVTIEIQPVPITLQVLAVLLAGLTLGARDGAASQALYLALITAGLPIDASGLGTLAWARPAAGYLVGFLAGAYVAGWLAERGFGRWAPLRFLAGLAGIAVIYAVGAGWLTYGFLAGDWTRGWALGVQPFLFVDALKALLATLLAESARLTLARAPRSGTP
ncbi:MAG: biotin transporter BioY [Anaerolineales bacterium]|nr:biotin transporter BioY [Anaerolineales bacterium]